MAVTADVASGWSIFMTEYQLLYLRFLQMKFENPHLKHDGHEPTPEVDALFNGASSLPWLGRGFGIDARPESQKRLVEREFFRPAERNVEVQYVYDAKGRTVARAQHFAPVNSQRPEST